MFTNNLIPWRRQRGMQAGTEDLFGSAFQQDMTRFFDDMLSQPIGVFEPTGSERSRFGAVDFSERDDGFTVAVDLPGVAEKDIDLELVGNRLVIKAKRERAKDEEREGLHVVERAFGSFARQLMLPDDIDAAKVQARLDGGVLTIRLPKTDAAQERTTRIPIQRA